VDLNQKINLKQFAVDWANITQKKFIAAILKKNIKGSALKNSITYRIVNGANGPEKVIFTYLNTGKFVDMGVGKGQKLGDVKGNKKLYKSVGLHGRVAKKWYSTTITSQTKRLSELLFDHYGISATVIATDLPKQLNLSL
jgi:hypothetical protein